MSVLLALMELPLVSPAVRTALLVLTLSTVRSQALLLLILPLESVLMAISVLQALLLNSQLSVRNIATVLQELKQIVQLGLIPTRQPPNEQLTAFHALLDSTAPLETKTQSRVPLGILVRKVCPLLLKLSLAQLDSTALLVAHFLHHAILALITPALGRAAAPAVLRASTVQLSASLLMARPVPLTLYVLLARTPSSAVMHLPMKQMEHVLPVLQERTAGLLEVARITKELAMMASCAKEVPTRASPTLLSISTRITKISTLTMEELFKVTTPARPLLIRTQHVLLAPIRTVQGPRPASRVQKGTTVLIKK